MVKAYLMGLCIALSLSGSGCARHSPPILGENLPVGQKVPVSREQETQTVQADIQEPEWEMHIKQEELRLPGVWGEYDILFLTDIHVVIRDERDCAQIAENGSARYAQFQNAEGISSAEQLADWIDYANEQGVDAVLLGGDVIDYPSEANLAYLEEQLGRLEMPYLYTMGNHDWTFPWEYMTEEGRERYLPLLESYMRGDTAFHTWETEDLLFIAMDDSPGQVSEEALEQYRELTETERPVIVLLHVPLLTQSVLAQAREAWSASVVLGGGNYGGIYPDRVSAEFAELITAKDSPVELVLAGHVHFYDRDYIEGDKRVLQLVGDAAYHGSAMLLHIGGEYD